MTRKKGVMDKLSIEVTDSIVASSNATNTYSILGYDISVLENVSADTMSEIVAATIESCMDEEGNISLFLVDFVFDILILDAFTNITIPDNKDDVAVLVYGVPAVRDLLSNLREKRQVVAMMNNVLGELERRNSLAKSEIASLLRRFNEILSSVEESMSSLNNSISKESVSLLSEFIKDGNVEEKIALKMADKMENTNGRKRRNRTSNKTSKQASE